MSYTGKRGRSAGGAAKSLSAQQIAAIAGARKSAKFPYAQFGTIMRPRGTDVGLARYGATWSSANAEQRDNRRKDGWSGRGLYQGRGGYIQDIAGMVGGGIGGMLGNSSRGQMIGSLLGKGAEYLTGRGLYKGRGLYTAPGNEVMAGSQESSPKMASVTDESGSVIISNKEYVGDIFAPATSGVFDLQSFPLNPGLEQTFPWLSQMAANYEEYEFIQLVFEFRSAIQDVNSTNGQVGTVIACTNYNAAQPLFTDKPQMVSYYGSITSKTTDGFISGVECDPSKLSGTVGSYIRTNPVLTGEDLKTYDHGNFQLATHNIPTAMVNGTLGELFVSYKIKLRKPKFLTGRGLAITRALFVSAVDSAGTLPLGTSGNLLSAQQNNIAVRCVPGTNNITLTFPAYYAGNLEIRYTAEGVSLPSALTTVSLSGNVTFVNDIYAGQIPDGGDGANYFATSYNGSSHVYVLHVKVSPVTNATDNQVRLHTLLGAGTITQAAVDIYEYNFSLNGVSGAPVMVNSSGVITPV